MANLQERRDKTGKPICCAIRVHRGRGADQRNADILADLFLKKA